MSTTYKWYDVYKAALLETDWSKMENRIGDAEAAIQNRKREFDLNHGGTPEENQALADAIHSLGALRIESAAWSRHKSQEPEKAS
ncbi:MAG: hypothetical protein ACRD20_10400 [Terriglobales bacterium]